MVEALDAWCDAFLYTHVDTEGMMQGIPKDIVRTLCQATRRQMIVAGGISSREEIEELEAMGADAVVGMALYLGRLDPNRGKERC
jgi:phosphoribosylformimino-5-aminoimidazole carboxamide ribotide isomerase